MRLGDILYSMKNKLIRFFGQYYLYVMVLVVTIYFLFILDLVVPLILTGVFALLSVLVAKLFKRIIHKKREVKDQLFPTTSSYAFPSSHAAGLSSILVSTFGDPVWYFIATSAAFILLARVKGRVHDIKDIVGGLLVGSFVTTVLIFCLIALITL